MNSLMQIEKLDDSNYATWCVQMKSVLIHADMWAITSGKEVRPDPGTSSAVAAFANKDEKALASILLCVKPAQINHIKMCKSAAEAWKKLQELHQPKGPARKIMIFKRLLYMKMSEGTEIADHVNDFVNTVESLAEIEVTLPEEILVIILLSSLSKSYENFVVAIETRDSLPAFNILKVKLLEEGARQKEIESGKGTTEVLMQTRNERKFQKKDNYKKNEMYKNKSSEQKNRKCFKCGQPGHFAAKCKTQSERNSCFLTQSVSLNQVSNLNSNIWCIDSGATCHLCCERELFSSYEESEEKIILPNNTHVTATGRGDVDIPGLKITLKNVLHVENIQNNFISVSKAVDSGNSVIFKDNFVTMKTSENKCILRARKENGLFLYKCQSVNRNIKCNSVNHCDEAIKWHNRFGHVNFNCLKDMISKNSVRGINIKSLPNSLECVSCAKGKICVKPFPQMTENRSKDLLQLIHSDICGPMNVSSNGGSRYFVTFIDDFSRYVAIYFLKSKDEVFEAFKNFKTEAEKQTGKKIKCLRTDNGREYLSNIFESFLRENGIKRQLTVPYTPQQNGLAERANRTLVEMARTMIIHSGLSETFWAEAVRTSAYLRNRIVTKILCDKTPFEMWKGFKPAVGHLKVFGAKAIVLDKTHKSKFSPKGIECLMIGYSEVCKGYRLYNHKNRKVIVGRDVIFLENSFETKENADDVFVFYDDMQRESPVLRDDDSDDITEAQNIPAQQVNFQEEECQEDATVEPAIKIGRGRPRLVRSGSRGRPRKEYNIIQALGRCEIQTPESVEEALEGPYADEWKRSMQAEYDSLIKNKTWDMVNLPKGQVSIGCKWVFAVKKNKDGTINKLKSRLVAKGCSQRYGINYQETFSPVVRYENIRLVMALAVEYGIYLHQMDVSSAYLNGDLDELVFMKQPPYFDDDSGKVLKLKKSLYGLKQSGRQWNSKLNDVLKKLGFTPCTSDPCIYTKRENGSYNIIVVYVDDLIVGSTSLENLKNIKHSIATEFEVVDGGELSHFLGMEFSREGCLGSITITQKQYIIEMLEQYRMLDCKEVSTPLEPGFQVSCDNVNCRKIEKSYYQSAIGALMYLGLSTRPDILLSVTKLAQRNCDPHSEHEAAFKHIMRYLKKTKDFKLNYEKTGKPVECFVDADWAGDASDRKSFTGYSFVAAGCVFAWSARKQSVVSLSTTEAEYIAISAAATEVSYLRKILSELNFPHHGPMVVFNDNQSSHCLVKNPTYHSRSKHIAIKYHHVRDMFNKGEIKVVYIPTDDMFSDILTKNLCKIKHSKFVKLMGIY